MYVHLDTPSSYALAKEQQNLTCQNAVVTEVTSKYTLSPLFSHALDLLKSFFWFTKACKQLRLHSVVQGISFGWGEFNIEIYFIKCYICGYAIQVFKKTTSHFSPPNNNK
jgi:hypothetical protein